MTRFLLYLCHKLHTKMRKKYYNVFSFPLLSQFFEHTQCTAAFCFWVLQNARQPWQCHQLRSSLWFQHCHVFFFYHTVPFSGWGWCGYIACCICTTKKTTNGCQEWLLLILLPRYSLSITSEKRSQFLPDVFKNLRATELLQLLSLQLLI